MHALAITDKQSFREAIHSALLLQTFCFAPARGRNPKHLRFVPIRVHCLQSVTDLVPQVRHSRRSASLTPLSSWLTDEKCYDNGGDGRLKYEDVALFSVDRCTSSKINNVKDTGVDARLMMR